MDKETPHNCQNQAHNGNGDSGDYSCSSSKISNSNEENNKLVSETVEAEVVKVRSLSISECLNGDDCEQSKNNLEDDSILDDSLTPGTSDSDPLLLKRSTRSHSRNYRNNHSLNNSLAVADESSNDSSENTDKKSHEESRLRNNEIKRPNEEVPESDPDSPLSKYMKHGDESQQSEISEPRSSSTTSGPDSSSHHEDDGDGHESGSLSRFFRILSNDEEDSENDGDEARRSNSGSPHDPHLLESSSSNSVVFEDEGSSSSSSDNYLEDLDDTVESQERETVTTTQDSSTPNRQTKKKTDSKKKTSEPPKVLTKPKAKELWIGPRELRKRELGYNGRQQSQTAELFRSGFYGSLFSAERLELMKKLEGHHGCVNCLNFNFSGTKLASGSDDLSIKIWNYGIGKCITSIQSGHRANVFQAKFVPFIGMDSVIVSCARDNQVRLNELSSSGEVCSSKKLAQHRGPAHKLSISPESPHVVLSCGEDSFVFSIDIREDCYTRLLNVRGENGKKVSLYSIHQNPFAPYEFCVSGKDQFVRIYDTRKLHSTTGTASLNSSVDSDTPPENPSPNLPVKKFCPHHLIDASARTNSPFDKTNVTAAVYSYNGREILATYNDENIYLFDSSHSDMADYIKKYEGHRNSATVKGVNFYGDRSQFIVSGSDCGHVFLWDKESESIVNFFRGDESGVVNCLESHPSIPILATSGLDDDVKIWIPSQEKPPKMTDLASTVKRNIRKREDQAKENSDSDGFIMWALINQMRRSRRRRRQAGELSDSDYSPFESDDDDPDAGGGSGLGVECSIC